MTASDLVYLAKLIIRDFPEYYNYFSEESFTWNNISQRNRNPLLDKGFGADGLKTGHTEAAGYGLVGSAKRGNRRITFVISGLSSKKARASEAEKLLAWAFRDFKATKIVEKNQPVADIPIWLGNKESVPLTTKEDIYLLVPETRNNVIETYLELTSPIRAPFKSYSAAPAKLLVTYKSKSGEEVIKKYPLFTMEGSESGNFLTRFKAASMILMNHIKDLAF